MPRYRDDEDRDDDREDDRPRRRRYEEPPPPSGGNTAVKIILILGGVFVAISLVCGGLVFYIFYTVKTGVNNTIDNVGNAFEREQKEQKRLVEEKNKGRTVVEKFLQEARANKPDAAYLLTTADYQRRTTRVEFADTLQKEKEVLRLAMNLQDRPNVFNNDPPYHFETTVPVPGKFVKVEVSVNKEGGDYKVDRFVIGK